MKKILIFFLASIQLIHSADPLTTVVALSSETIKSALEKAGLEHFDEKTKLSSKITGKNPLGVVMAFNLAIYDYAENLKDHPNLKGTVVMASSMMPIFFEELFKDRPDVIQELQKKNFLKKYS